MRCLSTTSRFVKFYLNPNNFLPSAREILVNEKSNAGFESGVIGLFGRGCSWVVIRERIVIRMR